eukprot:3049782-Ditylum_brightwellii.AAC.1
MHSKVSCVAVNSFVNQAYTVEDYSLVEGILATSSFTEVRSHVCIRIEPLEPASHICGYFFMRSQAQSVAREVKKQQKYS